ncbi:hypothetical protein [Mycobacterium sp. 29Ha]|nr:hypothetical protein [Mycobacterium sp. 29Ha]MDV3133428.1 hypothetical protein [Mycobacterium sp. 29Ha]
MGFEAGVNALADAGIGFNEVGYLSWLPTRNLNHHWTADPALIRQF